MMAMPAVAMLVILVKSLSTVVLASSFKAAESSS
jgi:hypothetical protein